MFGIRLKKISVVEGVLPPTCYKCRKCAASFHLVRESDGKDIDVSLCNVCVSAYLNFLDNEIIKYSYNQAHPELDDVK